MSAGLFSDVIDNYIFEKLDKQILGKLPYCLFLALGFSILIQIFEKIQNFSSVAINFDFLSLIFFVLLVEYLIIFLYLTYRLNVDINEYLEKCYINVDWQGFHEQFSDIFEGQRSLIKDIRNSIDDAFIRRALLSGIVFTYVCTWGFFAILNFLHLSFEIIVIALIVVTIFIFQEILKDSPFKDLQKNTKETALFTDMAEMYTIDNSIKDSVFTKHQSRLLLQIIARLIGPIIFINEPNFMVDRLLIYWNEEINKILYFYLEKENSKSEHYFELSNYQLKQPNRYGKLENAQIIDAFLKNSSPRQLNI